MHAFDYEEREISHVEKLQIEARMKQRNYLVQDDRHNARKSNMYIQISNGEEFIVVMWKNKRFQRLADAVTVIRNNGSSGYHNKAFRKLYGERKIETWQEGRRYG